MPNPTTQGYEFANAQDRDSAEQWLVDNVPTAVRSTNEVYWLTVSYEDLSEAIRFEQEFLNPPTP